MSADADAAPAEPKAEEAPASAEEAPASTEEAPAADAPKEDAPAEVAPTAEAPADDSAGAAEAEAATTTEEPAEKPATVVERTAKLADAQAEDAKEEEKDDKPKPDKLTDGEAPKTLADAVAIRSEKVGEEKVSEGQGKGGEQPIEKFQADSVEESNMANWGSDEHREFKQDIAKLEPAWMGVGDEDEPGLRIWRIEKFQVVNWPKEKYGTFMDGDSFICLNMLKTPEGKKSYDVYFWLGKDTSQDEAGTAAYKTVELDDLLGDLPVQYREVQGNESKMFLRLFGQMTILQGGVDTGFRKSLSARQRLDKDNFKPRLLHIRGFRKNVQVVQVDIDLKSLNQDDTFILDCGDTIYQWNGTKANAWERRKANQMMMEMKGQRHGKVKEARIVDGYEKVEPFWQYFGGIPEDGAIPMAPMGDDKSNEKALMEIKPHMVHITDDNDEKKMEIKDLGAPDRKHLNGDDVFIVDSGLTLYIWVGLGANKAEKREAMGHAVKYLKASGRGTHVPICRVMQGNEPGHFWDAIGGKRSKAYGGGIRDQGAKWKKGKD